MPDVEKEFVLKHVFKNVSQMKEGVYNLSNIEEHYGVPWRFCVKRNKAYLGLYLYCAKEKNGKEWSIDGSYTMKINSVNGKTVSSRSEHTLNTDEATGWGWPRFIKWDEMLKDFIVGDILIVEIHMKIRKMTGIFKKKNLRNFDKSNKTFSDVVLVVENQKFYVSKLFLACQSSYFNDLLLGNSKESKMKRVTFNGIRAEDFQHFLKILHFEPSISDDNVIGIFHLADKFDAKPAIRQCEEFLMEKSEKSIKEKLELAAKYKLENLKNKCLLGVKTMTEIRSVVPDDPMQLDKAVLASLLQKAVSDKT